MAKYGERTCVICGKPKSSYFDFCLTCDQRFYAHRLIRGGQKDIEHGKSILELLEREAQSSLTKKEVNEHGNTITNDIG